MLNKIILTALVATFFVAAIEPSPIKSTLKQNGISDPVLFVSRNLSQPGTVYYANSSALVGVGGFSRFQVAAPGYLCILQPNGVVDTLIDGSKPSAQSLNLIDVSAPSLSYDATKIVFAGLPNGTYSTLPNTQAGNPNKWRIYMINTDGTNLQQLTGLSNIPFNHQNLNTSQFLYPWTMQGYDDTDPVFLPDGRICFSSTRYPTFGMYNAVRGTNLFVVNADGTNLHRITTERNGAERPVIDPLTGKIVFSRWWRNFYFPYDGMQTTPHPYVTGGFLTKNGFVSTVDSVPNGEGMMFNNNMFLLTSVNPDGTGLKLWSTYNRDLIDNHTYGGSFDPNGNFVGNWFPIEHQTESSGMGGIRRHYRGAHQKSQHVYGVSDYGNLDYVFYDSTGNFQHSFGVFKGEYAAEPFVMEDGRILVSIAPNPMQDYGIYVMNADGSNKQLLIDNVGKTDLRAQLVKPKALPPIIVDVVTQRPSLLPPKAGKALDKDGTFDFDCLNIYYNEAVDVPIISAPGVGKISSVRFFAGHLRNEQSGSVEAIEHPIQYGTVNVDAYGRVHKPNAPANLPLFEQGRSSQAQGYIIPRTGGGIMNGVAQVTGFNYGRPGEQVKCVGCHAGHSMIEVPHTPDELFFTNLAPGANVVTSNTDAWANNGYLIDRKQMSAKPGEIWFTQQGRQHDEWIKLKFEQSIWIKKLVLYDLPNHLGSVQVNKVLVKLYSDKNCMNLIETKLMNAPLSENGTPLYFNNIKAQSIKLRIMNASGSVFWPTISLGEIEVIASHVDPQLFGALVDCNGKLYGHAIKDNCDSCKVPNDPSFNSCKSGITTLAAGLEFTIQPNPATEVLLLNFTKSSSSNVTMTIYDAKGNQIYTNENNLSIQSKLSLDISEFTSGVYFIEVTSDGFKKVGRFCKM